MFSSVRGIAVSSIQKRGSVMADLSSALVCSRLENQRLKIAHMPRNSEQGGLTPRQLWHSTIGGKHLT